MLSLSNIKEFYPQNVQAFERHILREYLQYKILDIIYSLGYGEKLVFLGGTALRIVYNNQRFSEDLDFDNLGLSEDDFKKMIKIIKDRLEKEGLIVETKTTTKASVRCYLKFPRLLFEKNISPHEDENLTIQIDTFPQNYSFTPSIVNLDNFDVYTKIKVVPENLLLSQKIVCAFDRKRMMGRDFFDINYLVNNRKVKPDFSYLSKKKNINNEKELISEMKKEFANVNFKQMGEDVSFLLMKKEHQERVTNFYKDVVESWNF